MNWKAWAPLAVAIVLGMIAAITAKNLVTHRPGAVTANSGAQVVIVQKPILPGQAIQDSDIVIAPLAWKEIPEGAFKNTSDVVGRVATAPLVKGEPILAALLAPQGAGPGLQALVPEGMRAITLEVNEVSSVGGLISPGCSVDVVATMEDQRTREHLARIIVQDVKVMAIGQNLSSPAKDAPVAGAPDQLFKSVTLLATPAEAETLELASMIGRPRLVLRGNGDSASAQSAGVSLSELVGQSQTADLLNPSNPSDVRPVIAAQSTTRPADTRIVKVIKGGVETTLSFPIHRADPQAASDTVLTGADTGPAIK